MIQSERIYDKEKILFVSDIRLDNNERDIIRDMKSQQKWTKELMCEWYMLKFRPPFERDYNGNIESRESLLNLYGPLKKTGCLPYISGDLMIQPYAPLGSGELRLIGCRSKRGDPYRVNYYDLNEIEDLTFAHNYFWRGNAIFKGIKGGAISPYGLAVEKSIIHGLDDKVKSKVLSGIKRTRNRSSKPNVPTCTLNNRAIPGDIGRILQKQCKQVQGSY